MVARNKAYHRRTLGIHRFICASKPAKAPDAHRIPREGIHMHISSPSTGQDAAEPTQSKFIVVSYLMMMNP